MFFNKEGVGHIEMIMSFVLFMGFLGVAFYFFSPFQSGRTLHSSLDYAFDEILEKTKTDLEIYSVVFPSGCQNKTIEISNLGPINGDVIILDINGDDLDGKGNNAGKFCIPNPKDFIKILINEEFASAYDDCSESPSSCNIISSSEQRSVVGKSKFDYLVEDYAGDYVGLKDEFNLPGRIDFGFSLISDDRTINISTDGIRIIPDNLEIISKVDRIEVATSEGIVFADLVVKVW